MGPQIRDLCFPQFVFIDQKPKKNAGSRSFQSTTHYKSRGIAANYNFNKHFCQFPTVHTQQHNYNLQYQGNSPNGNRMPKKLNNYNQVSGDSENHCNFNKYVKGNGSNSPTEGSWSAYASTASESDSSSHISSELTGFKIVHEGNVVHDETEEDFDSSDLSTSRKMDAETKNYAASVMVIGPNAKEIPLPSFA